MQNTLAIAIITFALLAGTLSTGLMASQSAKAQGITDLRPHLFNPTKLTNTQPPSTDKRQHTDLTITKGHNPASPNIVGLAGNRTNPGNTTSTSKATGLRITLHKIYITGRTLGGGGNSTVDERSGGGVNSTNPFNNGTVRLTPLTSSGSGNVTNQTNSAGVAAGITQLRPPAGFVNPMQNSTITANARAPGSTGNVTTSPCTLFLHQSGRCATVGLGGKAGKPPGNSTGLGGKAGKPPGNNTNPNNTTNPTGTVQLNPLASSCGGNTTNPGNNTLPTSPITKDHNPVSPNVFSSAGDATNQGNNTGTLFSKPTAMNPSFNSTNSNSTAMNPSANSTNFNFTAVNTTSSKSS